MFALLKRLFCPTCRYVSLDPGTARIHKSGGGGNGMQNGTARAAELEAQLRCAERVLELSGLRSEESITLA